MDDEHNDPPKARTPRQIELWAIAAALVLALICLVWLAQLQSRLIRSTSSAATPTTSYPSPSPKDATLADLLADGEHCYGSPEEFATARERALAAIDRIGWEQRHLTPTTVELAPALSLPASQKPNCFDIHYPQ